MYFEHESDVIDHGFVELMAANGLTVYFDDIQVYDLGAE